MFQPDECNFNGAFTLGFEFQQTFKGRSLAQCLFGRSTLSFKGSQVAGRNSETDLVADYFGLSPLFEGSIAFCPQIRNYNLKFESYWGLDNWAQGLYLRADMTFTHQERRLFGDNNCSSCCVTSSITSNTQAFPVGYMGALAVDAAPDILTALSGTYLFGDMQTNWNYGRISSCKLDDNKVAGFSLDLGYNFWLCDDSHFGIFLRYSAPTGTKANGKQKNAAYFFAPVIGNGGYNEFGGGLTAHKELWANDCGDSIMVYLDGYATHLFDSCQVRSFDFKVSDSNSTNCLSRYMLLKEMRALTADELEAALPDSPNADSGYAYNGAMINGINLATRQVTSSVSVQGDASLRFIWKHNSFQMALGYNIFGRSEEKLCIKGVPACNGVDSSKLYAFKGCTGDYYYTYSANSANPSLIVSALNAGEALPSNATSSAASITNCRGNNPDNAATIQNPVGTGNVGNLFGVDYNNFYTTDGNGAAANAVTAGTSVATLVIAQVSEPAVLIDPASVDTFDICSGRAARLISNKGFITLDYLWEDCCWTPYLELGGEVEGGSNCCDVKQWGVWVKGGFSF